MKARVEAVRQCIDFDQPMKPLAEALLLPNFGLQGDLYAAPNRQKQILLSRRDILKDAGLEPGEIGDHLSLSGIAVDLLPKGTKLTVGEAVIEISEPYIPVDPNLKEAFTERGAIWAKVVRGGWVKPGDKVALA